ncbi:MAG: acyl-CoA thioesterase [Thermoanaerobaculia bacterium]
MSEPTIVPTSTEPAIRVLMMPRDTNAQGTIFGGVILSYIDQAGAIEARRQGAQMMVTVAMDQVVFHAPVFVGDLVTFRTECVRIGTSSIAIRVRVEANRWLHPDEKVLVTEAEVTYVNIGQDRKPQPLEKARSRRPEAASQKPEARRKSEGRRQKAEVVEGRRHK